MRNERAKRAESLEAVTHTHTHTFIQVYRRIGGQSGERGIFYSTSKLSTLQSNLIKRIEGRNTFICNRKKADYK